MGQAASAEKASEGCTVDEYRNSLLQELLDL
jgi:hypothetical protein